MSGGTRVNQFFKSKILKGDNALNPERLETQIQTPKIRIQNSANDKLIINHLFNIPLQLRQNPSFQLKNRKHSLKQNKTRKQTYVLETQTKKTRITELDSFYNPTGRDQDLTLIKNTQQIRLQPIILTPQSQRINFSKQIKLIEDENIEEIHFQFVNMQQKHKSWIETFEKKTQTK